VVTEFEKQAIYETAFQNFHAMFAGSTSGRRQHLLVSSRIDTLLMLELSPRVVGASI